MITDDHVGDNISGHVHVGDLVGGYVDNRVHIGDQ